MKIKFLKMSAIAFSVVLAVTGCNDDTSDMETDTAPTVQTGVFVDAAVKGLGYQTESQQGTTNDAGEFNYIDGESVTFYLDGVSLGSAKGAAMLPVTMLPGTPELARILQTLDADSTDDLIDISSVTLTDEQKINLPAVLNSEKHVNVMSLENLVERGVVATHVEASLGTQKWTEALVSGKTFEERNESGGGVTIQFNSDYSGSFKDEEDGVVSTATTSWGLDADKDILTLTIMSDEGDDIIPIKLLGEQADGTLDVSVFFAEDQVSNLSELTPVTSE